jgi:hypothetical protein
MKVSGQFWEGRFGISPEESRWIMEDDPLSDGGDIGYIVLRT